ncbi:MAG: 23S rRNA (adenine(2503)-C(2))-methyltransferase RlmN [Kordiimonadaceae bacterium]|jgi:23S rRNA (adenine2503-C2)-methyltransferase|nr:23S rRNA (adenine(2503)-C(2))-methyltransferase RlmN [Kordiimonadaceae bacterium]MBT6034981.1 23S rRNA (adenine(2503)-C(2))-methyltransferase RlmN [Kordiimonadaceae bacterium]MBT6329871.1 23S rRNA (adenine(2503)-C(2))-methyltransferase RlmN [Kordiimonadaceae bacterium]MBT7582166.1 23S rRNA (adenine(2503)-C(2))-methyltransferase RlmN [Kordiimonadaceae bacterium]
MKTLPLGVEPVVAPRHTFDESRSLIGLTHQEVGEKLKEIGVPEKQCRMRAQQIWHWIYFRGAKSFDEMSNISKDMREKLKQHFDVGRPEIIENLISKDGTRKWLMKFPDGQEVETVFIPEEDRGTLCVSSQVGCTLTCKFCHTGTQRLVRNLTPTEIVMQLLVARDYLNEWPSPSEGRLVSTIVLMGMGEPLYNFENVKKAMHIVMDDNGINLSRRRITLSTSGVVPEIYRCGEEMGVNLAISLHAVDDKTRSEIMPINNKYPIDQLLTACKNYAGIKNSRKITFEYILLKDVNDSDEDALKLVKLIRDYQIPAKVNLIPFNPWPGSSYERPSKTRVAKFSDIIFSKGISAPIRTTRGEDILAACGQLKSESEKARKYSNKIN